MGRVHGDRENINLSTPNISKWVNLLGFNNLGQILLNFNIKIENITNLKVQELIDVGLELKDAAFVLEQILGFVRKRFGHSSKTLFLDEKGCSFFKKFNFLPQRNKFLNSNLMTLDVLLLRKISGDYILNSLFSTIVSIAERFALEYITLTDYVNGKDSKNLEWKYEKIIGVEVERVLKHIDVIEKKSRRVTNINRAKFPIRLLYPFLRSCHQYNVHCPYSKVHNDFNQKTRTITLKEYEAMSVWLPLFDNLKLNTLGFVDFDTRKFVDLNPSWNKKTGYINSFVSLIDEKNPITLFGCEKIYVGEVLIFNTKKSYHCSIHSDVDNRLTMELRIFFHKD